MEKRAWQVLLVADSVSSAASVRADIGQGGISGGDLIWLETSWIDLSVQDHPADVYILVESGAGWPGLAWLRACCTDSLPPIIYLVPTASAECESVAAQAGVLLFALDELRQPGLVLRRALAQVLQLGLGRPGRPDMPATQAINNLAFAGSKAGQEALRHRNAELEEVIASITEIQMSFDRDFRFISINPAATKFYFRGYQVEDLLGRGLWEMFPNMVGGIFDLKYHEAIESGRPVHFEAYNQPQDVWFEAHAFPNYGRLDVYLRDISARKRDELERERLMADLNHERVRLVYLVESLRTSEELYRATFENASVGISHVSLTGEWLKVNDRLCEITGYTRDELLNTSFQAITYPDDLAPDLMRTQAMLRGEIPRFQIEKRYIRKDGKVVWIHLSAALQRDEYGHPAYIISVIQDISGRKRLEAHDRFLIELSEHLARAQSQAEIISLVVEGVTRQLQVEQSMVIELEPGGVEVRVFGQPGPEESALVKTVQGATYPLTSFPPAVLDELRLLRQVVVEDTRADVRTRYAIQSIQADAGARAFVHSPFERDQQWAGMLTVVSRLTRRWEEIDLTLLRSVTDLLWLHLEKIRLLDNLRESEERLRLALSSSGVTVFGQDAGLRGTWVYNPDNSMPADILPGLSSGELLAPEDAARLQALKQQVLDSGEIGRQEVAFEVNGQSRYYQLVVEPAHDASGRVMGILASALDISERRRAEEAIREYARRLERSNRDLEDFAFIASHDLQEPLRKVRAFGQMLQEGYGQSLDETGLSYLERMVNAADRMQRMIHDLLAYSRVSTKGQTFAPVDLRSLATEVINDLEMRIQQSGGQVELGVLPEIEGDRMQLQQLLQNLIGNALKFHQPGLAPRVRINARHQSARMIELVVEDNGIGFPEQYLDRIFQPFQRLHGRGEFEGSGIGLAICRKIAERHGGSITAHSQPGQGSRFVVTLPVKH